MVKIIVVEVLLKNNKGGKNPKYSYDYNFVSRGVIDVSQQEVEDIKQGYLDSSIIDRINDELGLMGISAQLRINSKKKHGGTSIIWAGEI